MIEMLCNGLSGFSGGSLIVFALDGASDMVACPFYAESLDPITEVYIYPSISSSTPTYKVSLQELDANGYPSGTILGGGSPASATFNPTSLGWSDGVVYSVALDNSYTPTHIGQYIVAVIEYVSGTIGSINRTRFSIGQSKGIVPEKFPYFTSTNGGSSWTVSNSSYQGIGAYKTASASYGIMATSYGVQMFSSSSSPNEYAVKFTVPSSYASYKIRGVWIPIGTLSGDFTTTLYSGGDTTDKTALHSIASDEDWFPASSGTSCVFFGGPDDSVNSTLQTLTGGNTYRIAVKADTTTNLSLRKWEFPSSALRAAVCFQEATQLSTRSGTGDWTDDDTMVMPFAFMLEDVVAGGGGGSAVYQAIRGKRKTLGI